MSADLRGGQNRLSEAQLLAAIERTLRSIWGETGWKPFTCMKDCMGSAPW